MHFGLRFARYTILSGFAIIKLSLYLFVALIDSEMESILQHHYSSLVDVLPMDDARFRSKLYSAGLLPGNLKEQVKAKSTQADKAEHFLDHAIKNDSNFKELVKVMEECSDHSVQRLAKEIKPKLFISRHIESGEHAKCDCCMVSRKLEFVKL